MTTEATTEEAVLVAASTVRPASFATECDLVMKGGITSGIVYPLALTELSKAFRLRSIGGTSAGAIAAAAAAAAELGRQRFKTNQVATDPDGFATLGCLPHDLSSPAPSGVDTQLLAFFKPKRELQPAFDAAIAALAAEGKSARVQALLGRLLGHYWVTAAIAFLFGTLPLWMSRLAWSAAIWLVAFAALLAVGVVIWRALVNLLTELPKHGFGFCSGMPAKDDPFPQEALTTWLAGYIDKLSAQDQAFPGQNKPLTFGDLKSQRIHLEMMTTCLTLGRPFRMPFRDDEQVRENKQFMFRKSDFEALFPANVVAWMVAKARPYKKDESGVARLVQMNFEGFLNLPDPDDLPVVVAARMSLSFPVLLSAVPLYAVDYRKDRTPGETPERCWFTDGGVGSNFPIHFFDAPLSTRPTFGFDLGLIDSPNDKRVVFPKDNNDARLVYWHRFSESPGFESLVGFLTSVVSVAKDWNHETLSHLPGFRDRIGLIRLSKDEGGLNLTMSKKLILELTKYGREAGQEFVRRFGDPSRWPSGAEASLMDWENHQSIRLRLLIATFAELVKNLKTAVDDTQGTPHEYDRFFSPPRRTSGYPFNGLGNLAPDPVTGLYGGQAGLARWILDQMLLIAQRIEEAVAANSPPKPSVDPINGAPKPTPELKARPRV